MIAIMLFLAAGIAGSGISAQDSAPAKPAVSSSKTVTAGPDDVLREFLLALGTLDEKKLRSLALPHDDFETILKGQAVPDEVRKNFESFVKESPIKPLKPGDMLKLPGGRSLTVEPADVSETSVMLMFGRDPMPHRLRKIDGAWKIDPSAIIAARKAAEAARKKKASQ